MSWFTSIFDSNAVVNGIDKSILTPEERLDYQKELLKAYEPFKLIQRFMALMIGGAFLFVLLITTATFLYGVYGSDIELYGDVASEFSKLEVVQMVGYSFMTVVTLYFSGGVLSGFKKSK